MPPPLRDMHHRDTRILAAGAGRLEVIRLLARPPAPVAEPTARLRIQQFLYNRALNEAIAGNMRQLKSAAKIEYLGEFAGDSALAKGKGEARPGTQKASPETKAGAAAADAQGKAPSKKAQAQQEGTDRGARGLR